MDLLEDIFDTLNLRGALYFRTEFSGPWAVTVPELEQAARFHLVMQGNCHVELVGGTSVALTPGDLVMIPRGRSHILSDRAGRNARPLETVLQDAGYDGRGVLRVGERDPQAETQLLCGHYTFRTLAEHPLINALPGVIVISMAERLREPWLDEMLRMMAQRVFSDDLGSATSVKRLSEIVFSETIRIGVAKDERFAAVLDGFRDPQVGRALELIHAKPENAWTVASLAKEVAMSRSAFAKRFSDTLGVSPMRYISDWRLQRALELLENPRVSVQRVASDIGYQSPAAFSRAFSGKFGLAPADYRRTP